VPHTEGGAITGGQLPEARALTNALCKRLIYPERKSRMGIMVNYTFPYQTVKAVSVLSRDPVPMADDLRRSGTAGLGNDVVKLLSKR
jgi:hypothetical protein